MSEMKTIAMLGILLRRFFHWAWRTLRTDGWVIWVCGCLVALGYSVWTWQWWAVYLPLCALVEISHHARKGVA